MRLYLRWYDWGVIGSVVLAFAALAYAIILLIQGK